MFPQRRSEEEHSGFWVPNSGHRVSKTIIITGKGMSYAKAQKKH